jgi:hypothetical protein
MSVVRFSRIHLMSGERTKYPGLRRLSTEDAGSQNFTMMPVQETC